MPDWVIGAGVGFAVVVGIALVIYGMQGRGPKMPPRRRPQRQPRRGGANPFQDVINRGRR